MARIASKKETEASKTFKEIKDMPKIHYKDRLRKIDFDEEEETNKIIANAASAVITG